jgi:hypothetical protein
MDKVVTFVTKSPLQPLIELLQESSNAFLDLGHLLSKSRRRRRRLSVFALPVRDIDLLVHAMIYAIPMSSIPLLLLMLLLLLTLGRNAWVIWLRRLRLLCACSGLWLLALEYSWRG